ncbi:MAG TPA: hypothetical protein ENJ95_16900 [Bacteroidetes bacterium]|nr:hypothetical protein [Bacteroidota bacterium]
MAKIIISLLIWLITLFGLNGAFGLVRNEYLKGNICPKTIGIPACYIIFACLIFILISETGFLKDNSKLFFIGAGIAWLMAVTGTVGQIFGWIECPKTGGGFPMCYISFAMFSSLIILKYISGKI